MSNAGRGVPKQKVNAWIFLNEDEPKGTNYNSTTSCYQRLITDDIYKSVDILFMCFVNIIPTSAATVPTGDGTTYTLEMGAVEHSGGLTNQIYMESIIADAPKVNPDIHFGVTLNYGDGGIFKMLGQDPAKYAENVEAFANNLVQYMVHYNLTAFDIDWESPLSDGMTETQFEVLFSAIGARLKKQQGSTGFPYMLTFSPAVASNMNGKTVNENVAFVNLQLYSGFTDPSDFTAKGIDPSLLAYGAKFETVESTGKGYQTAQEAYDDNKDSYQYPIFTAWRLNSDNYEFEQDQQVDLYKLAYGG